MNEKELIRKALGDYALNKEQIRMAALADGSTRPVGYKGAGIMKKRIMVGALALVFCAFTIFSVLPGPVPAFGAYGSPENYGDLYKLISSLNSQGNWWSDYRQEAMGGDKDNGLSPSGSEDGGLPDYSDTNIQVEGVQEADIIKTDGKYIYALSWEYLYILKADAGNLQLVSKIKHMDNEKGNGSFFELYLTDGKLIALHREAMVYAYDLMEKTGAEDDIGSGGGSGGSEEPSPAPDDPGTDPTDPGSEPSDPGTEPTDPGLEPEPLPIEPIEPPIGILPGTDPEVTVVLFDVSDPANPKKINTLSQKGDYISSRMVGNYLYLATNYYVNTGMMERNDAGSFVPQTGREGEDPNPLEPQDIYIAPDANTGAYVTLSGIDCSGSGDFVSSKAVLGSASNLYSTVDTLYITNYDGVTEDGYYMDKTGIIKFSLDEGKVSKTATGSVFGTIINQFSMDEYNGYFRIATTLSKYKEVKDGDSIGISTDGDNTTNGLYILSKDLKLTGKIDNLAPGERIYSVRFDGETGYIVTFKQIDPLFAVDLGNPSSPKVLSALKIPGFSEYMQPFGDGLLFGLGKEADDKGMVTGLKLSMFDVSDKTNVKETAKYVLKGDYIWTEASWNHKAILVSPGRNLIAFPSYDSYFIFGYDKDKGFTLLKQVKIDPDTLYAGYYYGTMRGLYIDDFLYVYTGSSMMSYSFPDFAGSDSIGLK